MSNLYFPAEVFEKLTDEVRDLCTQKGWRTDESGSREGHEFPAYLMLGVSELAEALEAYRDKCWSETCSATDHRIEHHPQCSGRPHDHPKPVGGTRPCPSAGSAGSPGRAAPTSGSQTPAARPRASPTSRKAPE